MAGMTTSTGVGSGLPIEKMVTQLVASETSSSQSRLDRQEKEYKEDLSALGKFKSAMSGLQDSLEGISDFDSFSAASAESSNEEVATATAGDQTATGSYDVQVDQLASAHRLASEEGAFSDTDETVGNGELTIQFGEYSDDGSTFNANPDRASETITIDSSNNTLAGVRDAINDSGAGVSASIVDDGNGPRLSMTSERTGSDEAMRISVDDAGDGNDGDDGGLSRLAYAPDQGIEQLTQTQQASNAQATIDGIDVTSSSNTLEDAVDGMSIDLKDTGQATIEVAQDTSDAKEAVQGFVDSYNEFMGTTNELTQWSEDPENRGPLSGDSTARMAVSELQQTLTEEVEGVDGPYSTLTELGLDTQRDGTLVLDEAKLDEALANDAEGVGHLLAESGSATDDAIEFAGALDSAQPGQYDVSISQEATRGVYTGGQAISDLQVDDGNDELTVAVDGVTSGNIALTQKTYDSEQALADELQSRINGDANLSDADVRVQVDVTENNELQIRSERYGSDSRVDIEAVDTDTETTLGLSAAQGDAGQDVAGTIGGNAATGDGQYLRADAGDPEGIRVRVDGGGTGDRGAVSYSEGIAGSVNQVIDRFTASDGTISNREDSVNSRLDEVDRRRDALNDRMESLEQRYRSQFASLDASLAEMQETSSFLSQELGGGGGLAGLANMNV